MPGVNVYLPMDTLNKIERLAWVTRSNRSAIIDSLLNEALKNKSELLSEYGDEKANDHQ